MKTLRILPALLLGLTLSGCPTAPRPDPIPPSPKVVSFTATPGSVTPGREVTLAWTVTDATKVTIADVERGDVSGVDDKLTGTLTQLPTANALYVLTALNDRGAKATAFVSVTVSGADPDKLLFAAYPQVVPPGETGTLIWAAPGAKSVSITPMGGAALDLMGQVESGSVTVDPSATETPFTLNADGQTRTITVTRGVAISELTLSAPVIEVGEMTTVSWKTSHATKITLSSPGVGTLFESTTAAEVAMGSHVYTVPTLPSGSVINYVLDAEGPGGTTRKVVTQVIGKDPVITEVTAPEYARTGEAFTLAWKAANADVVQVRVGTRTIYESTSFSQVATGSVELPAPAMDTVYTVAAVALPSGLAATKDATVKPVGVASVMTFTATPTTVSNGGDAVTLTWNAPNARRVQIVQDSELTVVWKTGAAAESGTATVYPNKATSRFVLTATNTLDPAITANADVTVTTVAELSSFDGGLVFEGGGTIDLGFPVGTEIYGLPSDTTESNPTSTGFVDIAMTGTKLTFSSTDNGYVQFPVPGFETYLYGTRYAASGNISVCTNGFMALRATTTTTATPPSTFPGTSSTYDQFLAPFWTDLELGPNGAVYWEIQGEAPNRLLIVQWDQVRMVGTPMSSLTFQAQISQTGVITFEYETLDNLPSTYTSVSGLQSSGGRGLTGTPTAGGSLRFFGPKTAPASVSAAVLPVSGFVKVGSGFTRMALSRFVRAGDVRFTEVMFAPAATVPSGEWFEVVNNGTATLDLNGYEIDFGGGATHTIASSLPLLPGAILVLGQTTDTLTNDGVTVNYAYGTTLTMPDTNGTLTLRAGATSVASITWTGSVGGNGNALNVDGTPVLVGSTLGTQQCTTTQTFGSQVPPQTGTPGTLVSCFGYVLTSIPAAFDDISLTGTPAFPLGTVIDWLESPASITLPVAFPYFGTPQTQVWTSPSGWLDFQTQASAVYSNRTSTSATSQPVGAIALFWDDLENFPAQSASNVFWTRRADHTVIQWSHFTHWLGDDDFNFQVKLFDNGRIELHYGAMSSGDSSNYGDGNSATVWIEQPTGAAALPIGRNEPVIQSNTAYRYTPTN